MTTKQITFDGVDYTVPEYVSWAGRNRDGRIVGYQYEPFEYYSYGMNGGYYSTYGQECVLYSPECKPKLERVK